MTLNACSVHKVQGKDVDGNFPGLEHEPQRRNPIDDSTVVMTYRTPVHLAHVPGPGNAECLLSAQNLSDRSLCSI